DAFVGAEDLLALGGVVLAAQVFVQCAGEFLLNVVEYKIHELSSSINRMSVGISETEQRLRDDSALDLGRTAVDGDLARVDVGGEGVDGTVRQIGQALALDAVGDEVEALRHEHIDEEFGDVLLQLGALELEHGRAWVRLVRTGRL